MVKSVRKFRRTDFVGVSGTYRGYYICTFDSCFHEIYASIIFHQHMSFFSERENIEFVISVTVDPDTVGEAIRKYMI